MFMYICSINKYIKYNNTVRKVYNMCMISCKEDCNMFIVVDGDTLIKRGCKDCCNAYFLSLTESFNLNGLDSSEIRMLPLFIDGINSQDIEDILVYANSHTLSGTIKSLSKYLSIGDIRGIAFLAEKCRTSMFN